MSKLRLTALNATDRDQMRALPLMLALLRLARHILNMIHGLRMMYILILNLLRVLIVQKAERTVLLRLVPDLMHVVARYVLHLVARLVERVHLLFDFILLVFLY